MCDPVSLIVGGSALLGAASSYKQSKEAKKARQLEAKRAKEAADKAKTDSDKDFKASRNDGMGTISRRTQAKPTTGNFAFESRSFFSQG